MPSDRDLGDSSFDQARLESVGSGFTLIELVIVIAILGILAGTVLFALGGTTQNAAQAACTADAKSVETAIESYKSQFGNYPSPPANSNPSTVQSSQTYYMPLISRTPPGPWLRAAPSPSRYEIWYDGTGDVFVTAPGTTSATDSASNDADVSNPNVCTLPTVVQ